MRMILTGLDLNRKKLAVGSVRLHPTHSEAGLWSKSLRLPRALDREKFMQAVGSLPPRFFVLKGILEFQTPPKPCCFNTLRGALNCRFSPSLRSQNVF